MGGHVNVLELSILPLFLQFFNCSDSAVFSSFSLNLFSITSIISEQSVDFWTNWPGRLEKINTLQCTAFEILLHNSRQVHIGFGQVNFLKFLSEETSCKNVIVDP